jgi:hypothetical protein
VFEECAAEVRPVSYKATGLARLGALGSEIAADEVRQVRPWERAPEVLDWAQFWRVRRQVLHFEPRTLFSQVTLDLRSTMRREPVPQQDGVAASKMPIERAQIIDELRLFNRASVEPKAQSYPLCCRCDDQTRDGQHALPVERRYEDGVRPMGAHVRRTDGLSEKTF